MAERLAHRRERYRHRHVRRPQLLLVPASQRGVASGMRSTFQNSGTALSIGAFFSLMIAGLASSLPKALTSGLQHQGVPHSIAYHVGALPPVSSLFSAVLGMNPLQ